jgi:circadian clock protein KaiC
MFTSMSESASTEQTGVGLSSAFDTWIHLSNVQGNLERNRTLVVVKSRGMAHSNQVREFVMSNKGVELMDIYTTASGTFMGTARLAQAAADEAAGIVRREGTASRERQIVEKRRALEARITVMRAEFESDIKETELVIAEEKARDKALAAEKKTLASHRESKPEAKEARIK